MVRSLRIGHNRFFLGHGVNTLLREPGCTVCINDASGSRGHARLTIDGEVETESDRQLINQIVLRTSGVKDTVNNLELIGVDSHIPSDFDD